MNRKKKQDQNGTEKFSAAHLGMYMLIAAVLSGLGGLFVPAVGPLLCAAIGACLGGIWYCDRFDSLP